VWTTDDWDPALRFWTLPFDPNLSAWLPTVDPSRPAIMAAREFGSQSSRWQLSDVDLLARKWLEADDLRWRPDPTLTGATLAAARTAANTAVRAEIEELQMLMQDDRERYLAESEAQADGLADYVILFLGIDRGSFPWTVELINCALAIGNIAYFTYKARFHRVRPSYLCPGLTLPYGPPRHPSYPSGHSFLGHLIALLLLEIPAVARRYGIFPSPPEGKIGARPTPGGAGDPPAAELAGRGDIDSPLLWLAARLAKNRERLGVHYPSDSSASRHLAAGIWQALMQPVNANQEIVCPTLKRVIARAKAEWA
jgi:membrane-associated phospholipid phosphatase